MYIFLLLLVVSIESKSVLETFEDALVFNLGEVEEVSWEKGCEAETMKSRTMPARITGEWVDR
jgi:hypothetical protein